MNDWDYYYLWQEYVEENKLKLCRHCGDILDSSNNGDFCSDRCHMFYKMDENK
jgi:hypothetical protein